MLLTGGGLRGLSDDVVSGRATGVWRGGRVDGDWGGHSGGIGGKGGGGEYRWCVRERRVDLSGLVGERIEGTVRSARGAGEVGWWGRRYTDVWCVRRREEEGEDNGGSEDVVRDVGEGGGAAWSEMGLDDWLGGSRIFKRSVAGGELVAIGRKEGGGGGGWMGWKRGRSFNGGRWVLDLCGDWGRRGYRVCAREVEWTLEAVVQAGAACIVWGMMEKRRKWGCG
ncbi:hypothetical protein Tco_0237311 [Tanacetum coccineum]